MATAHWEEGWRIWELESGRTLKRSPPSPGALNVALSGDGRWMATIEIEGLWLWDLEQSDSAPIQLGDHHNLLDDIEFSPCGRYPDRLPDAMRSPCGRWTNCRTIPWGAPLTKDGLGASWQISISPDGENLALGRDDGSLLIVPTARTAGLEAPSHSPWKISQYPISCVTYSPDGRYLATGAR